MVEVIVSSNCQSFCKFSASILIVGSWLLWRNGRRSAKTPQPWDLPTEKLEPGISNTSFHVMRLNKALDLKTGWKLS
jgi:hypothetical protein